jgi:four helix bundle protein
MRGGSRARVLGSGFGAALRARGDHPSFAVRWELVTLSNHAVIAKGNGRPGTAARPSGDIVERREMSSATPDRRVGTSPAIRGGMATVHNYKELMAWQLADEMQALVHRAVSRPAFDRRWDLRRQLVRAAESPCANLAEGFARYHPREFARFVRIAKGSLTEVLEHVRTAQRLSLLPSAEANEIAKLAHRALGAATRLAQYLESAPSR